MPLQRYAIAVLAVGVAILGRWPLQPLLGTAVPYLLFFPGIAVTAWYGGLGPGVLATILSAAAALYWFVEPCGSWVWPGTDVAVSVPLFLGVGIFISALTEALHRAERRAATEGATLAATVLSIGDGVIVTDAEGRVRMMNAVAERLTGWLDTDSRGRPIQLVFRIMNEATRSPVENPVGQVLRGGVTVGLANHTVLIARDGTEHPIDDTAAPIRDADGAVSGVVLVFRDVTARRRTEMEREAALDRERAARMEAEAANRIKDEFLATLSHELRTPLHAILGWASMLADSSVPADRRAHATRVIVRNAEAQSRLIEDLLDMSRFVTGKMRLALQPVDLGEVIADAMDSVRVAADAKRISLSVELAEAGGLVMGDPARLRQLLWNLVSNGVKFTPPGGRIAVSVRPDDFHVELRVADTGVGLDPDLIPRIFERFTQADSSMARVHGGLGLGLALVRHIAEAHGGSVRAESAGAGAGSAFIVSLPRVQPAMTSAEKVDATQNATSAADVSLRGVRVLVVEDDDDSREVIELVLRRAGAEVRAAASAASALQALPGWRPDAVITDIGMAGQDGFDLRRRLVDDGFADVPAIALTGYAGGADRDRSAEAGFVAHLTKPVDLQALPTTVKRALAASGHVAGDAGAAAPDVNPARTLAAPSGRPHTD